MIEEKFAIGSSFLHKRDPRGKIVAAVIFTTTVALLNSFIALILSFGIAVILLILANLIALPVLKRIAIVNGFTLFLWIMLPLTYGGEQFYQFGPLPLSKAGIILAAIITLKTNTIISAVIALLTTSTIADLGHSLDKLHFPKKLCFILLYSYRYVFVIYQEYNRLLRAAKMRSFSPSTNMHTYKTFAYLFGMTLVNSYNRSQRVYQAMLLRGFDGQLISLQLFKFTPADTVFLAAIVTCTLAVLFVAVLF